MRIVVIGGTGHIGSYLTPLLFEAGHQVICVARGERKPYRDNECWRTIEYLRVDRSVEEASGNFGNRIAGLNAQVVIDLTCYYPASAMQLANALAGRVEHFIHCGTIWVHGPSGEVPTTEDRPREPFGDYGIRKAAIEAWLMQQFAEREFPVTVLHPGHLVGPGWNPINPAGNFNVEVFRALSQGREVALPNFGMETLNHVHAADVARAFAQAVENSSAAIGESFHVVAATAMTLRWYAEKMAEWFGQPARLKFLPLHEWKGTVSAKDATTTEDHLRHSPHCSIGKAQRLLGYKPRYTSIEAVQESVASMRDNGVLQAE